jgi:hypothetical protein
MTFVLKDLGAYRIERSEDYNVSEDKAYGEIIRVKGSEIERPYFMVPSHLYKYSESELGLYLKDHKNAWRSLSKILNVKIDISDEDIMLHFPVSMFPKIASIIRFVKKRGQHDLTDDEKDLRYDRLKSYQKSSRKVKQKDANSINSDIYDNITLDAWK